MTVVFYPTVTTPFPYAGVHERCAEGMLTRTIREGAPIVALLNHDDEQVLASTADGSLRLTPERDGLRAELDVPDTALGRRLAAALAAGTVTGCSIGFTPRKVRWYLDGPQLTRELLDADIHELSLLTSPRRPANGATWAAVVGPNLRKRYDVLRARPGTAYRPPEVAPAAVVLRLAPLSPLPPVLKALLGDYPTIARERKAVQVAAREGAKVIDIVYPRPLAALIAATARHTFTTSPPRGIRAVRTGAVTKPWALPERPVHGRVGLQGPRHRVPPPSSPKGVRPMHDDSLPMLHPAHASRREIPGPGGCDGFETLRRLNSFRAELERRLPGASRWIKDWHPFTDRRGVWHANPRLRERIAPLTVRECLEKMEDYR